MEIMKKSGNGGGASLLSRYSKGFEGIAIDRNCFLDDAPASGSAIVSKTIPVYRIRVNKAFTLAEVLITLGIIGIVAAMTIPTLISNYKEKELITRNKQAYSLVIQALNMIKTDSSSMVLTDTINPNGDSSNVIADLSKYFKGAKVNNSRYYIKYMKPVQNAATNTNGGTIMPAPNLRFTNGMILGLALRPNCRREYTCNQYNEDGSVKLDENGNPMQRTCVEEYCAMFTVDVNGENPPNQFGRDAFLFNITKDNYKFLCSNFAGCIEDIVKYNKLPDGVVEYEMGGEFVN